MSKEKERLAQELLQVLDVKIDLIRGGFAQVTGSLYKDALADVERAYYAWKNAR